jgi:hypothetical protein
MSVYIVAKLQRMRFLALVVLLLVRLVYVEQVVADFDDLAELLRAHPSALSGDLPTSCELYVVIDETGGAELIKWFVLTDGVAVWKYHFDKAPVSGIEWIGSEKQLDEAKARLLQVNISNVDYSAEIRKYAGKPYELTDLSVPLDDAKRLCRFVYSFPIDEPPPSWSFVAEHATNIVKSTSEEKKRYEFQVPIGNDVHDCTLEVNQDGKLLLARCKQTDNGENLDLELAFTYDEMQSRSIPESATWKVSWEDGVAGPNIFHFRDVKSNAYFDHSVIRLSYYGIAEPSSQPLSMRPFALLLFAVLFALFAFRRIRKKT